jgi:hypothetical protein
MHAKTKEERKKIVEHAHFHFSKEDFKQAYKEKYHRTLTDEELRGISAAGAEYFRSLGGPELSADSSIVFLW